MKRKLKTWQEKLDPLCVRYLQVYREARAVVSKIPPTMDVRSFMAAMGPARQVFEQHPEVWETRKVSLTTDFVQKLKCMKGFEEIAEDSVLLTRTADILEMTQNFALFDSFPEEMKIGVYFFLALMIVPAWDSLIALKKEQFGERPLDQESMYILIAQSLETMAQVFRGRLPEQKGKLNTELIRLVRKILEGEKEHLTVDDIRNALAAAGVTVAEGETLRVWLWRAQRDGLIPARRRGTGQRQEKPQKDI